MRDAVRRLQPGEDDDELKTDRTALGERPRLLACGLLMPVLVKNHRELLTAGIAGIAGTGIDVAVLVLLVARHVSIPLATFVAALAGAGTSFVLNKYVAFRDRSPLRARRHSAADR